MKEKLLKARISARQALGSRNCLHIVSAKYLRMLRLHRTPAEVANQYINTTKPDWLEHLKPNIHNKNSLSS